MSNPVPVARSTAEAAYDTSRLGTDGAGLPDEAFLLAAVAIVAWEVAR